MESGTIHYIQDLSVIDQFILTGLLTYCELCGAAGHFRWGPREFDSLELRIIVQAVTRR